MSRTLRKDAADRRTALLKAAEEAFAEFGYDVPLDVIADRAGVGRATLYRNFSDRGELAAAVFMAKLDVIDASLEAYGDDPRVFFHLIDALADVLGKNAGLDAALREARSHAALAPMRERIIELGRKPLARTQAAGLVRSDLTPFDLRVIVVMLGAGASRQEPSERPTFLARIHDLLVGGVQARPDDAEV